MIKGGYKIIDFKGSELSTTAIEVSGIFEQITNNYDKAILVSGASIDGELKDDAFASFSDTEDSVLLTVYGGVITVTEDDEVTFASAKSNTELAAEIGNLDDLETTDKDSVVEAINEVNQKIVDRDVAITSSTVPGLCTDLITNMTINGLYRFHGSFTGHTKGYSAFSQRFTYGESVGYSGLIIVHEGTAYTFTYRTDEDTPVIKAITLTNL